MLFLSTLSLRRATQGTRRRRFLYGISIHALLAESDFTSLQVSGKTPISIHALLAESDAARAADTSASCNFYPRSPCGERPQKPTLPVRFLLAFLSTLSLRRATRLRMRKYTLTTFLSTLSLRRATLRRAAEAEQRAFLSTLSLRRATTSNPSRRWKMAFLSTLSLRRATLCPAMLTGRNLFLSTLSLRRATLRPSWLPLSSRTFLSTLSLRRATGLSYFYIIKITISIHALLAESDFGCPAQRGKYP